MRKTMQREAIRRVFERCGRPLKVPEIVAYGRRLVPTLDPATVYRNLGHLEQEGFLVRQAHPEAGTFYERRQSDHHHHFFCRRCERLFVLPGCSLCAAPDLPQGFVAEEHQLFFNGLCGDCHRKAGPQFAFRRRNRRLPWKPRPSRLRSRPHPPKP